MAMPEEGFAFARYGGEALALFRCKFLRIALLVAIDGMVVGTLRSRVRGLVFGVSRCPVYAE